LLISKGIFAEAREDLLRGKQEPVPVPGRDDQVEELDPAVGHPEHVSLAGASSAAADRHKYRTDGPDLIALRVRGGADDRPHV